MDNFCYIIGKKQKNTELIFASVQLLFFGQDSARIY